MFVSNGSRGNSRPIDGGDDDDDREVGRRVTYNAALGLKTFLLALSACVSQSPLTTAHVYYDKTGKRYEPGADAASASCLLLPCGCLW